MIEFDNPLTGRKLSVRRRIGEFTQGRPGPLLVVIAGLHGNERSGVIACDRVMNVLRGESPPFFGHIVGVAGHLAALAAGVRYLDRDLNRIWQADRVAELLAGRPPAFAEEAELADVVRTVEEFRHRAGENVFLDLHTTSSESVPYISVPHDAASVELASGFPLDAVVGAGDALVGVADRYWIDRGFRGFTFEAGQHGRLASIEAQEAMIWTALHRLGCLVEPRAAAEPHLARTQLDGPRFYRVAHVHRITPGRGFRMKPGFFNFQRVRQGDLLAWEGDAPIVAPCDGRIFLPLYQPQGDDGFTIVQPLTGR